MDRSEFQLVKSVDVRDALFQMGNVFRAKSSDIRNTIAAASYAALVIKNNNYDGFSDVKKLFCEYEPDDIIREIIDKHLFGMWDCLRDIIMNYSEEVLKSVLLFHSSKDRFSRLPGREPTPDSVIKLAAKILEVKNEDRVLDMCSGTGDFTTSVFENGAETYTGIEINPRESDVALLKAAVLGENVNVINDDALYYHDEVKYTKAFSNYPFMYKGDEIEYCRHYVKDFYNLDWDIVAKASSDWIFNAKLFSMLDETGKAVAIMTNGAATNVNDRAIREYFINSGFIEAVISLPAKLFQDTNIPVMMIVFSRGNCCVTLADAEEIYESEKRINYLTDNNIEEIIKMSLTVGSKVVKLPSSVLYENDYCLKASRYLDAPQIQDGVEFESVIKNIFRGSQIKTEELEKVTSDEETDCRYITLANVVDGSIEIDEKKQYIGELTRNLSKFVIPEDALIISKLATPSFRTAVASSYDKCRYVAHGNLFVIELDKEKVNPYYLQAFFENDQGEHALNYVCSGSNVKTLSLEAIKKITIPLPDIDEQNRIAKEYSSLLDMQIILKRQLARLAKERKNLINTEQDGKNNG